MLNLALFAQAGDYMTPLFAPGGVASTVVMGVWIAYLIREIGKKDERLDKITDTMIQQSAIIDRFTQGQMASKESLDDARLEFRKNGEAIQLDLRKVGEVLARIELRASGNGGGGPIAAAARKTDAIQ
jgi:hypothetical protein